jgi:hypothetical protein
MPHAFSRRPGVFAAGLLGAACLAAPLPAAAGDWLTSTDFTGACGTTMVCAGAAATDGSVLRLVPAAAEQAGAAWAPTALSTTHDFVSTFSFQLGAGASGWRADGLAFLLAANPAGLGDSSRYGGSMGFEGVTGTVAVEFDTFDNGEDPGGNHVAVDLNGVLGDLAAANPYGVIDCDTPTIPGCLANGAVWTATVAYDAEGQTLTVTVQDGDNPAEIVITGYSVNLEAEIGPNAFLGFGAGTGLGYMAHDLRSWRVTSAAVPEPASALAFAAGLAALGLSRRRR